jgi:hypothetical protein
LLAFFCCTERWRPSAGSIWYRAWEVRPFMRFLARRATPAGCRAARMPARMKKISTPVRWVSFYRTRSSRALTCASETRFSARAIDSTSGRRRVWLRQVAPAAPRGDKPASANRHPDRVDLPARAIVSITGLAIVPVTLPRSRPCSHRKSRTPLHLFRRGLRLQPHGWRRIPFPGDGTWAKRALYCFPSTGRNRSGWS